MEHKTRRHQRRRFPKKLNRFQIRSLLLFVLFMVGSYLYYLNYYLPTTQTSIITNSTSPIVKPPSQHTIQDPDLYIFAQIYPSAWQTHSINKTNLPAPQFTVHGLWPEWDNATWPAYCQHTALNLNELQPILPRMQILWQTFSDEPNSQLWGHELRKHGSCVIPSLNFPTQLQYFNQALRLQSSTNLYTILQDSNILPTTRYEYYRGEIVSAIERTLGVTPLLNCTQNPHKIFHRHNPLYSDQILEGIYLCYDNKFNLRNCTADIYQNFEQSCPNSFYYWPIAWK